MTGTSAGESPLPGAEADAGAPAASSLRLLAREHGPAVVGLVVVLIIALHRDFAPNLTLDEAFSLDTARRSVAGTWSRALTFELQPPLYFLVLKLWLTASRSLVWARLLSTVLVASAVLVSGRLARALGSRAALLPLLLALSPTVLWMASYARCYAMAFLLGAISTLYAVRLIVTGSDAVRRDAALYAASGLALVLTFYYGGFVLAGHAAAATLSRRGRTPFALAAIAMAAAFVPWVPTVLMQVARHPVYTPAVVAAASPASGLEAGASWVWGYLCDIVTLHSGFLQRPVISVAVIAWWVAVIAWRLRPGPARWRPRLLHAFPRRDPASGTGLVHQRRSVLRDQSA